MHFLLIFLIFFCITSVPYKDEKKKPSIPHKGPKGFGGTTLISTVPKCLHIARSSSDNAGKTPYFNCTELRGRFHNSRTESFHHCFAANRLFLRDSSLGLLLMYYSLHRRKYFAFDFILCEMSGCVKSQNYGNIPCMSTPVTVHSVLSNTLRDAQNLC